MKINKIKYPNSFLLPMAETLLKDLLEDFDKTFPNPIGRDTLLEKHSPTLIESALGSGILNYEINNPLMLHLSNHGINLLIQIRVKKSIDNLDKSIQDFNKSSTLLNNRLLKLTIAIVILTIIYTILTAFTTYKLFK